jgi:hypothetical protein
MATLTEEAADEIAKLFHNFQRELVDRLDSQYRQLHEQYQKSYYDVDEYAISPSSTGFTVNSQSTNYERITQVVAYCGPNAGRVTLGDRQLIIPAGSLQSLAGVWRLAATDVRKIESVTLTAGAVSGVGAAGLLYLELFGTEIPTGSLMW